MTLKEFIEKYQTYNDDFLNKEIFIIAPNGLKLEPVIKKELITEYTMDYSDKNTKSLIITYE